VNFAGKHNAFHSKGMAPLVAGTAEEQLLAGYKQVGFFPGTRGQPYLGYLRAFSPVTALGLGGDGAASKDHKPRIKLMYSLCREAMDMETVKVGMDGSIHRSDPPPTRELVRPTCGLPGGTHGPYAQVGPSKCRSQQLPAPVHLAPFGG
jgi:hypothetical protein